MIVATDVSTEISRPRPVDGNYVLRVLSGLRSEPGRVAIEHGEGEIYAGQLAELVLGAASFFQRRGVRPGQTVAVLTETNHPAMLAARYAAHISGAAVCYLRSMNPRADADMLPKAAQAAILRDAGATVLVTDEANVDRARSLAGLVPGLTIAGFGFGGRYVGAIIPADGRGRAEGGRGWVECGWGLVEGGRRAAEGGRRAAKGGRGPTEGGRGLVEGGRGWAEAGRGLVEIASPGPEDLAMVALTSGSTGRPKCVRQSFRAWNATVAAFPGATSGAPGRFLAVTPVSHTVGSMADAILAAGGGVVLHRGFDPDAVLQTIAQRRITDLYLAVPQMYRLVDDPRTGGADLSSLRRVIYSGTPAAPHRIAQALGVFGDALAQLYGTTEAGGIATLTPQDHREPELLGTAGRPFPWVRAQIRDPRSGRPVRDGQAGEVWVTSATLMDGYLNDPADTAQALRDGWLRTGDLGHWDQYGYLNLAGRTADAIKTGGLKVYPAAVERVLLTHPAVSSAAVYGVADADRIEHVQAAVSLRPGADCSPAELRSHVAAAMTPLHAPASIRFCDELPLNDAGKPDKARLAQGGIPG
jgi:fatty-acyl-CoA synthase